MIAGSYIARRWYYLADRLRAHRLIRDTIIPGGTLRPSILRLFGPGDRRHIEPTFRMTMAALVFSATVFANFDCVMLDVTIHW